MTGKWNQISKNDISSITEHVPFEEGIPVHVRILKVKHYPLHNHDHKQVLFVLDGEVDLRLSYMNYRLSKNDLHIINVRDTHTINSIGNEALILILTLDTEHFKRMYPDFIHTVFISYQDSDQKSSTKLSILRSLIFRMTSEFARRGEGYLKRLTESANAFMYHLHEDFQFFKVNSDKKFHSLEDYALNRAQYERINRIIVYIYAHYNEKISLSLLAEKEHVSKYYLSHLIKNTTGENFQNFQSMVRVEQSEAPLLETQNSIHQISLDCGFSNMNYYISHFRKWFGMYPGEYREKYRPISIIGDKGSFKHLSLDKAFSSVSEDSEAKLDKENSRYSGNDGCFKLCIEKNNAIGKRFNIFSDCHFSVSNDNILQNPFVYNILQELSRDSYDIYLKTKPLDEYEYIEAIRDENDFLDGAFRFFEKYMKPNKLLPVKELFFQDLFISNKDDGINAEFNGGAGLISRSGLKKPLFYAASFLMQLGRSLISNDSNYILTRQGDEFILLLVFNENIPAPTQKMILDLKGFNSTQIVSSQIISKTTPNAVRYWKDLGAPETIDRESVQQINGQTHPSLQYNVLSKDSLHEFEIDIAEKSFMLMKIRPL